jgi:hypothetical protein
MGVPETGYGNTRIEIEISFPIEIGQRSSFASLDGQPGEQRDRLQAGGDESMFFIEKRFHSRLRRRVRFREHGHVSR